MNFQILYQQYTSSFAGFIGFQALSIYVPHISPFLGVWYHTKELINNLNYTDSLNKEIVVQLPGESQPISVSCKAAVNLVAATSNIYGLVGSILDLGHMIVNCDDYTETCVRYKIKYPASSGLTQPISLLLNLSSIISNSLSYISTVKEYDFIDTATGMNINPYLITYPKTKVLQILEQTEDCKELGDFLISSLELNEDNIEAITIPCA